MTREKLIADLAKWRWIKGRWSKARFCKRDALQFALWWYGASTERDKGNPKWPGEEYVKANRSGGPRYMNDIGAAMSLIPGDLFWIIGKGRVRAPEPLYGVWIMRREDPDDAIASAEGDSLPIAICIAAIKARIAFNSDAGDVG